MTTVKDFIEYLQKLPEDTEVKVIENSYITPNEDYIIAALDLDESRGNIAFTDNNKTLILVVE